MDTLYLYKGQVLRTNNRIYPVHSDTIVLIPSNIKYEIMPSKTDQFFNRLAASADKRRLTRELHNIILHSKNNGKKIDSLKTVTSIAPYIPYAGMYIRNIQIQRLQVFGPNINDTSRQAATWVGRSANSLHILSKEFLIRNNLLFSENDVLIPLEIADNERILRKLPYIEDAKVIATPVGNGSDSVDIVVIVKDVWAKAFNIRVENVFTGGVELWDKNIMGLGHELQNNILWNTHESPRTGYEGTYIVNNIGRSFINGKLSYYNSFHRESVGVEAGRSFYTPNVKYAGGISVYHTSTRTLFKTDTLRFERLKFNDYDIWIGRSLSLGEDALKNRHRITFSARMMRDKFLERPQISRKSYYDFQNKTTLLGSISYSRHNYFESNYIYNFGRTEDIPVGSVLEFTLGHEFNEYADRKYAAVRLSAGLFPDNLGYVYGSFQAGSFFSKSWIKEQAAIQAKLNYFTPLIITKRYKFRHFVNVSYTGGFNRFSNEYLLINDKLGLPGFFNDSLTGLQRFNIQWEINCFAPWNVYDFRFVLYAFSDNSWLAKSDLFKGKPFSGIGLGIRIRNQRLVFNTIQLRFAFYPRIPADSKVNSLIMSGETLLNTPDFLPTAPQILPFK